VFYLILAAIGAFVFFTIRELCIWAELRALQRDHAEWLSSRPNTTNAGGTGGAHHAGRRESTPPAVRPRLCASAHNAFPKGRWTI
jgi:hypothetical protein